MPTIIDYLDWRGDLPLCEAAPLNEVDAVILARISNLPFKKVHHTKTETIGSMCTVMKRFSREEFQMDGDVPFVEKLAKSRRFSDLVVTDYEKRNDPELEMQFAAVTIHLPDDTLFLSFCGTDSTLLGWKENLNMSFRDDVPAQCAALSYAARTLKDYPDVKTIYTGGHSKGGNLAAYATVCLPRQYRPIVKGVFSCDGPGFSREFIAEHDFDELSDRIHTFLPVSSVVGRVLEHVEGYETVESSAESLMQHDMYTWQVMGTQLVRAEKSSNGSEIFYNSVRHLIEETTPRQRQFILDGLYSVATARNATSPKDIQQDPMLLIQPLVKELSHLSRRDRKVVTKVFRAFGDAYVLALKDVGTSKIPPELIEIWNAKSFQEAFDILIRWYGESSNVSHQH
ncbi:MAG: DUF2974 domain-containing protein [Clostridia bacterium]|nr:DUF2974 domain-containing protein [Clostridia bacterium]